jgi:hypothetical protein
MFSSTYARRCFFFFDEWQDFGFQGLPPLHVKYFFRAYIGERFVSQNVREVSPPSNRYSSIRQASSRMFAASHESLFDLSLPTLTRPDKPFLLKRPVLLVFGLGKNKSEPL